VLVFNILGNVKREEKKPEKGHLFGGFSPLNAVSLQRSPGDIFSFGLLLMFEFLTNIVLE